MSFNSLLTETATLWVPSSNDGYGNLSYSTPSQILVRWQDVVDNFQDEQGEEFISDAVVYSSTPLVQNSFLYRGTSTEANPQDQEGAYRLRRNQRSQTPNGSIVVYKNILGD